MSAMNGHRNRILCVALLGSLIVAGCGGDPSSNKANFEPTIDTSQAIKSEDAATPKPGIDASSAKGKAQ